MCGYGGGEEGRRRGEECTAVCVYGWGRWKGTVVYLSTSSLFLLALYEWPRCEAIFLYVELHVPVHVLKLAGQTHH